MSDTATRVESVEQQAADNLLHFVCCLDPDGSGPTLCGLDGSTLTWTDNNAEPVCVVCDEMDLAGFCARGGRCDA